MPNHCANRLTVKGPAAQVEAFRERAKGEEEVLDLNKFIPMPEDFRNTEPPNHDADQAAALTKKYGKPDWYTWTATNWGTKWGCYDGEIVDEGDGHVTYQFYTASSPFKQSVLQKMSKGYPGLLFTLTFAEQLMDFWGVWDAAEGDIVGEGGGDGLHGVGNETVHLLAGISG